MSNLLEQLKQFADACENIREDIPPEELAAITKDVAKNIDEILEYIDIVERDAEYLRERARKYADAAKQQENKAKRIHDYVKFALKSQGFKRFKTERNQITLSESTKIIPNRLPTFDDYWNNPDLIKVDLEWARKPNYEEWVERPADITPIYEWKMDEVEKAGRDDLMDYKITDRLLVKVAKK